MAFPGVTNAHGPSPQPTAQQQVSNMQSDDGQKEVTRPKTSLTRFCEISPLI